MARVFGMGTFMGILECMITLTLLLMPPWPTAALEYNYMAVSYPVGVNTMPNIQMFRKVQMVDLIFAVLLILSAWCPVDKIQ